MIELNDKQLEKVSGGTPELEDIKRDEFETAWVDLQMNTVFKGKAKLEELYNMWQSAGYKPAAKNFLKAIKTKP